MRFAAAVYAGGLTATASCSLKLLPMPVVDAAAQAAAGAAACLVGRDATAAATANYSSS